jgi:hypothetical protein
MKKSTDTIGNRTRDLVAQCLNQLRHRVSDPSCLPHAGAVAEILCCFMNESDSRRKSHESDRHSESCHSDYDEIRRHFIVDI